MTPRMLCAALRRGASLPLPLRSCSAAASFQSCAQAQTITTSASQSPHTDDDNNNNNRHHHNNSLAVLTAEFRDARRRHLAQARGGGEATVHEHNIINNDAKACGRQCSPPLQDPSGVFANSSLRLDLIKVYGFDFDYTLAHYGDSLHPLIYASAIEHLVKELRYPDGIMKLEYDSSFPIRGLHYDRLRGYLFKLDFFHCIERGSAFFGRRRVQREQLERDYGGGLDISPDYQKDHLVALMDLFCLSEICLIADVIQYFVDNKLDFDPAYVYEDVRGAVQRVHASGRLHRAVLSDPDRHLAHQPGALRGWLERLHGAGRRLFLLSNSPFWYIDGGMRHLFRDDGRDGATWRELFDVVAAAADKPAWYQSERPFRQLSDKDEASGLLTWHRVNGFERGRAYVHGNLRSFLELTGWRGPEVLYFGDHLVNDLRGPARAHWRTAAVIRELERDVDVTNGEEYRREQAWYHTLQRMLAKYHHEHNNNPELRAERLAARRAMRAAFNPHFGSAFTTADARETWYAYVVQRYADVYTAKLENFANYPVDAWLVAPHDVKMLPHHVKLDPDSVLAAQPVSAS
eukprot:jgi/Chlat1/7571/Chrsp63S09149